MPESGGRIDYDSARCWRGGKVHLAVDTLGHPPALCVTAADEQDQAQVSELARRAQSEAGETAEIAYIGIRHFDVKERCKGIRLKVITGFRRERLESPEG
jgi:hypothetical protein